MIKNTYSTNFDLKKKEGGTVSTVAIPAAPLYKWLCPSLFKVLDETITSNVI